MKKNKTFRNLLLGFTAVSLTESIAGFALIIVFIMSTHNIVLSGILGTIEAVTVAIAQFGSGSIVDLYAKRVVALVSLLLSMIGWAGIAVLLYFQNFSFWLWAVFVIIANAGSTCASSAESASVRFIVEENEMAQAMSIRQIRMYLSMFLGPLLGGLLVGLYAPLPFILPIFAGLIAIISLLTIWGDHRLSQAVASDDEGVDMILGGLKYVLHNRFLLIFTAICLITPFALEMPLVIFEYNLAFQRVPAWMISLFPIALGIGGVVGSIMVSFVLGKWQIHVGMLTITVVTSVMCLQLIIAFIGNFYVQLVLFGIISLLAPMLNPFNAFLMTYVPKDKQGRVFAIIALFNMLPSTVVPAVVALLIPVFGERSVLFSGVAMLVVLLSIWLFADLREIPEQSAWATYITTLQKRHNGVEV